MTAAVLSERIPDPLTGQVYYRVSRVFPDFASLTVWLRKNITHGNGVEA